MIGRLEESVGQNLRQYVQALGLVAPGLGAACRTVAGGAAAYCGVESPLTTVKGAGPGLTDAVLDELEGFFAEHEAPRVTVESAPWHSAATRERLAHRGYQPAGVEDVMIREGPASRAMPPSLPVEQVPVPDWPELMRQAFELPDTAVWQDLCAASARLPGALLLGVRDEAGAWMACAQAVLAGDVWIFGCDGTLPPARGRGAQRALIEARLGMMPAGALVSAEVAPGGGSQRNYFRAGFRLAYSRTALARE